MRRRLISSLFLFLIISTFSVPAYANSAQRRWSGTDATGAIVTDEACPIVVEHELLTFDIGQFPETYYQDVNEYMAYSGTVTAEYTFYNPADYTVEATLVFPFGAIPDYGGFRVQESQYADTEKHDITVNGVPIHKTLRHTLKSWGGQFELDEDLALLHNGFVEDDFYSPEMPVTSYAYMPADIDNENYRNSAYVTFVVSEDPTKTKVYMEAQNGGRTLEGAVELGGWVTAGESFVVNVIGEPLNQMPVWKFYENGTCETEIDVTMTLVKNETVTLKEFLLQQYDPASGILDYDWYNAMVASLNCYEWEHGAILGSEISFDITRRLMRWYEYEISIGPGERIVNTVTAPIYPDINGSFKPPLYEYTYLLSPAQTWADFGALDIVVNTPYYMTLSGPEEFRYNNPGYELHLPGLPEGELTFTLCAEKNSKVRSRFEYLYPLAIYIGVIIAITVGVAIVFSRVDKKEE